MLATMIVKTLPENYQLHTFKRNELDITNFNEAHQKLIELQPDIIINCAAHTNVDGCESQPDLAQRVNGDGPGHLAKIAEKIEE